ncbi:MAG: universal stress protein [Arcobacteraceae bacterium]
MKKNIVVATDFSQRSFDVINKAMNFAKNHNNTIHVVHIIENSFLSKLKDEATVYENSFTHIKEKIPSLVKENFHCRQDTLEDGIERYVKELNAYMVIIGSSGERSSIIRQFLGTSTKSIVRSIDVPCLVLKSDRENLDFSSILMPTDLSEESKQYLSNIHELFPKSKIELLYSYLVPFEGRLNFYGMDKEEALSFQENMKRAALEEAYNFYDQLNVDKGKVKVEVMKEGLDPKAFSLYADEKNCDMIAIHTTGNFSFFAFDILEHSRKDILITKI